MAKRESTKSPNASSSDVPTPGERTETAGEEKPKSATEQAKTNSAEQPKSAPNPSRRKQLKILQSIQGPDYGYCPGEVVAWPDAKEAGRLIAAGCAEPAPANHGQPVRTHGATADSE